jgi:hypothetical protein
MRRTRNVIGRGDKERNAGLISFQSNLILTHSLCLMVNSNASDRRRQLSEFHVKRNIYLPVSITHPLQKNYNFCWNTWWWPACRPKHVVCYYKGILTLKKSGCDWWLMIEFDFTRNRMQNQRIKLPIPVVNWFTASFHKLGWCYYETLGKYSHHQIRTATVQ